MKPRILLTISMLFASSFTGPAHASESDDAEAIRRTNNFYAEIVGPAGSENLSVIAEERVILYE